MSGDESAGCLPKRKPIRLSNYDYSTTGAYFITFCTAERRCILSDITVGAANSRPLDSSHALRLTAYGEIVDFAIRNNLYICHALNTE